MNTLTCYRTQNMNVARNGNLNAQSVFIEGNSIYTRDYWHGLNQQKRQVLIKKHPGISAVFGSNGD